MKNLLIAAVALLCLGCGDAWMSTTVENPKDRPLEVKIVNNPNEAQIKALEARVERLETWAVKQGGRLR